MEKKEKEAFFQGLHQLDDKRGGPKQCRLDTSLRQNGTQGNR
jgi:hypothetical protein